MQMSRQASTSITNQINLGFSARNSDNQDCELDMCEGALNDKTAENTEPEVWNAKTPGSIWSERESQILKDLLMSEGDVSSSFGQIHRTEDAIKRKWRKLLATLPVDKRERIVRRNAEKSQHRDRRRQVHDKHKNKPLPRRQDDKNIPSSAPASGSSRIEQSCPRDTQATFSQVPDQFMPKQIPVLATNRSCFEGSEQEYPLSPACADCRRRHKRCSHRAEIPMPRVAFVSNGPAAAPDVLENKSATHSTRPKCTSQIQVYSNKVAGQTGFDPLRPSLTRPTRSHSAIRGISPADSGSPGRAMTKRDHRYPSTKERGRLISLTASGKRRGRPPKWLVRQRKVNTEQTHQMKDWRRMSRDSRNTHTYDVPTEDESQSSQEPTYLPRKRRAIDDYEYSRKFDEIILRQMMQSSNACKSSESGDRIQSLIREQKYLSQQPEVLRLAIPRKSLSLGEQLGESRRDQRSPSTSVDTLDHNSGSQTPSQLELQETQIAHTLSVSMSDCNAAHKDSSLASNPPSAKQFLSFPWLPSPLKPMTSNLTLAGTHKFRPTHELAQFSCFGSPSGFPYSSVRDSEDGGALRKSMKQPTRAR